MKKIKGLTTQEAQLSKEQFGTNELSKKEPTSMLEIFVEALKDKWILILVSALIAQVVKNLLAMAFPIFGESSWIDPISISAAIVLSTGFATYSEWNSEKAFIKLYEFASKVTTKVFRDGKLKELVIDEIVKGDYVLVQTGDNIPVDGIISEGELKVNQATLNGESDDAKKVALEDNPHPSNNDTYSEYKVFRGSSVVSGEAVVIAEEIGDSTMIGTINTSLQEDTKESPSKAKLSVLADNIGKLGYSGAAIYALVLLLTTAFSSLASFFNLNFLFVFLIQTILYSVTIIIMAVPEGLPMMLAMVASMNSGKLFKENILIRNPEATETAGYMNLLAFDKTGTVTAGTLEVVDAVLGNGHVYNTTNSGHGDEYSELDSNVKEELITGIGINNDSVVTESEDKGRYATGSNPTDKALLNFLIKENTLDFNSNEVIEKEQFNSATKFASVTLKNGIKYIKGAPEYLLDTCTYFLNENGEQEEITDYTKSELENVSLEQAARSMRLLAIIKEEKEVRTLIAIVCIRDNIRPEVPDTIKTLNKAHVHLIMITGDRKETAVAIAKEAGLIKYENGELSSDSVILTHDELSNMTDDEVKEIIPKLKVVARALPMDKKRLVNLAQDLDYVVGMTGDGVNDAPALKSADVGFAMGDGTETAREASDIVIVNNSLSSIARAILYGRTMTKSVQKFITFQLTVNVSTIALSIASIFFGITEVFPVVFVLWINLIMDTFAALMFGEEPPLKEYMKQKPAARKDSILTGYMKSAIGVASIYITLVVLAIMGNLFNIHEFIATNGETSKEITTFYMTFFVYAILFNALNTRSTGFNLFKDISKNKKFLLIMFAIVIAQTAILYFGGVVFGTVPLDAIHYLAALGLALLIIPIDFVRKAILKTK